MRENYFYETLRSKNVSMDRQDHSIKTITKDGVGF